MRIRRRPADAQEASSSSHTRPLAAAAAPPPSAPRAPAAPCTARRVQPPAPEVDRTTREVASVDPRPTSSGWNRQEEKEEGDRAPEDGKRGEEDGISEHEHKRPAYVIGSTPAAPKRVEEERPMEVEENKSGDSRRVEGDEEKTAVAVAAMCKKGDGKGWHCKRAAQCGYSLCQYHLDKLRSYYSYSQKKKQKKKPKAASAIEESTAAGVHQRAPQKENNKKRRVEADVLSTEPGISSDSFYYYSGFGPRWGKRRGGTGRSVDGVGVPDGGASQVQLRQHDAGDAAAAAVAIAGGEDDDGYDYDASSRDGKPLKSRALSSLL